MTKSEFIKKANLFFYSTIPSKGTQESCQNQTKIAPKYLRLFGI